jgi:hypothetical protein
MKDLFLLLALTLALANTRSPAAPVGTDDPWVGTWKMILAKSKTDPERPLNIKSRTDARTRDGDWITTKTEVESTDGRKATNEVRYKLDGQDYLGSAGNTVAVTCVGPNELHFTFKRDGKVVSTGVYKLAPDGRSYTATLKGLDAKGEPYTFVAVMEKQ